MMVRLIDDHRAQYGTGGSCSARRSPARSERSLDVDGELLRPRVRPGVLEVSARRKGEVAGSEVSVDSAIIASREPGRIVLRVTLAAGAEDWVRGEFTVHPLAARR